MSPNGTLPLDPTVGTYVPQFSDLLSTPDPGPVIVGGGN